VIALPASHVHLAKVTALPDGTTASFIGMLILAATGFGLGWVYAGADYSRYLPGRTSRRSIIAWTTLGGALGPVVLFACGEIVAGSSKALTGQIANDPIGTLTTVLPHWFLVPFIVLTILGLVGATVMDVYSSGLNLQSAGLRLPRHLADLMFRRRDYDDRDLYNPRGRYGDIRVYPLVLLALASVIGFGLVTNTAAGWLSWQGYLLGPLGLGGKTGTWAGADLGVVAAILIGFVGMLITRGRVHRQETTVAVDPFDSRLAAPALGGS
jgi:NCS1 family nucleobase:cation symporter-1